MKSIAVIPTYNEAENILSTLDATLVAVPTLDIPVVDDDSPDGTARLVLRHPAYGDRVHLMVRAEKSGLDALGPADVAIGSRYVAGGAVESWWRSRRLLSAADNVYLRLGLGIPAVRFWSGERS